MGIFEDVQCWKEVRKSLVRLGQEDCGICACGRKGGGVEVAALEDAREEVDEQGKEEEDDVADREEGIVPHCDVFVASSKGYCDGNGDESIGFCDAHQSNASHCWFAKRCSGRRESDQPYKCNFAQVREKRPW